MMPCIMIGDSIAVGVGQARPECETVAVVGISSERYVTTMLPPGRTQAGTAIISLGVNDDSSLDTLGNLRVVRARIAAQRVVWLLPGLKENVRAMIRAVAAENGDRTVDTRPQVGRDHLHPNGAGYEIIAAQAVGPASGVEVAYAPAETEDLDRPLRRASTPRERIRRLRAIRHAEVSHGTLRAALSRDGAHRITAPRADAARPPHGGTVAAHHGTPAARTAPHRVAAARAIAPPPPPAMRTKVAATCAPAVRACRDKGRSVRS